MEIIGVYRQQTDSCNVCSAKWRGLDAAFWGPNKHHWRHVSFWGKQNVQGTTSNKINQPTKQTKKQINNQTHIQLHLYTNKATVTQFIPWSSSRKHLQHQPPPKNTMIHAILLQNMPIIPPTHPLKLEKNGSGHVWPPGLSVVVFFPRSRGWWKTLLTQPGSLGGARLGWLTLLQIHGHCRTERAPDLIWLLGSDMLEREDFDSESQVECSRPMVDDVLVDVMVTDRCRYTFHRSPGPSSEGKLPSPAATSDFGVRWVEAYELPGRNGCHPAVSPISPPNRKSEQVWYLNFFRRHSFDFGGTCKWATWMSQEFGQWIINGL